MQIQNVRPTVESARLNGAVEYPDEAAKRAQGVSGAIDQPVISARASLESW